MLEVGKKYSVSGKVDGKDFFNKELSLTDIQDTMYDSPNDKVYIFEDINNIQVPLYAEDFYSTKEV